MGVGTEQRSRSGFFSLLVCLFCLLGVTPSHPAGAESGEPWAAPFSGDPKAILEAAEKIAVADDQPVVLLLEDNQYTIDANRRTVSKVRKVFRILKPDVVDEWGSVEQEYQPWHENRPELRARVITAEGKVHWLDPKTVGDSPVQQYDPTIFTDSRMLRAPLPAIGVGAVAEYEVVIRETAPLLDAGVTRRIIVPDHIPIQRFRLGIEAHKSVSLRHVARLIPESAIRQHDSGSVTRIECVLGPIKAREGFESYLPSDTPEYPYFSFSTGRSWQEVAARYESIVDQQLGSPIPKLLLGDLAPAGTPRTIAARLTAALHKEIRYTGVEFGEAAIVPRTPAEVLERKYGDCKDKSALLVAMLRAAGLDASVALLASGFGLDVDAELPGFGVFNHAIVYVGGEDPLWIDATATESRVGELPLAAQGRLALIASRRTTALVRTPESQAADNWRRHTIEIRMSEMGAGDFSESIEAGGAQDTQMRQLYDGRDERKTRETLERYVKEDLLAKSLVTFAATKKDDVSEPFRLRFQVQSSRRAVTAQDSAAVALFPYLVFQDLPFELQFEIENVLGGGRREPRKHDFVLFEPHQIEYRYRIIPPAHFKPASLPESQELKLGSAIYTRTFQREPDGTVEAVFRFDTGKRRLSPAEFEALRDGLEKHGRREPELIAFVWEAGEYMASGEMGKAVGLVREDAAKRPDQVGAQIRLSRVLMAAGAVESGLALARSAVERDPSSSPAWQALGWAHQHDSFGRRFQGNWNRAEAERCQRKAVELDPEDMAAKIDLAILLEHNVGGERYGKGAGLDEAISAYREALKIAPEPEVQNNLAIALLYKGRYQEAREEVRKLSQGDRRAVLSIALTALLENPAQAILESQAASPDSRLRAQQLLGASQILVLLRAYERASELTKAAARTSNAPPVRARVEVLERLKRYQDALYPASDPRYPIQQMTLHLFSANPEVSRLKPLFTRRKNWKEEAADLKEMRKLSAAVHTALEPLGLVREDLMQDFIASLLELEVDGEEAVGFRIRGKGPQRVSFPTMFVVREDGQYRILGSTDEPQYIGELVLELVERKEIKAAQWWLDKMIEGLRPDTSAAAGGQVARFLWAGVTDETRGPRAIRVTAASLIGPRAPSDKALRILQDARARAEVQIERAQLDWALCETLEKAERWEELLIVARRLGALSTFSRESFEFTSIALTKLKWWKELQAAAKLRLKTHRWDNSAHRAVATALAGMGDLAGAAEVWRKLRSESHAYGDDRIAEAWVLIRMGKVNDEVLALVDQQRGSSVERSPDSWYTLGFVQVLLGKPEEAYGSLHRALEWDDNTALDARPWVLLGKICEQYALPDAAAIAYEKARSARGGGEMAEWALALTRPSPTPKP